MITLSLSPSVHPHLYLPFHRLLPLHPSPRFVPLNLIHHPPSGCTLNPTPLVFPVRPSLSQVLQRLYLTMRAQSSLGNSIPVTTRHLESLIRLSQARARLDLREVRTVCIYCTYGMNVQSVCKHCTHGQYCTVLSCMFMIDSRTPFLSI